MLVDVLSSAYKIPKHFDVTECILVGNSKVTKNKKHMSKLVDDN